MGELPGQTGSSPRALASIVHHYTDESRRTKRKTPIVTSSLSGYDACMGSAEGEFSGGGDRRHDRRVAAIKEFDRNLDAMMYPVSREGLKVVTWKLLIGMMDYTPREASTRVEMLEAAATIPTEWDLEHEREVASELLKVGLFYDLPEEYMYLFGRDAFTEWIGPFIESALEGHTAQSSSYEHLHECPGGRFCSSLVAERMFADRLVGSPSTYWLNESKVINEEYVVYPENIVYMNVTILRKLEELGVFSADDAEDLMDDYMRWLDSHQYPIPYDKRLFDVAGA